ncbi:MAG: hypothetical protein FJ405_02225 [Verrucomicrobia bacterium]|nr:hypothetical protein [Verrucomicrobiota bacterium]
MIRHVSLFIGLAILAPSARAAEKTTFDDHVAPILRNHCLNCHNADKKKAGLDASTYGALMAGGTSGKAVAPEDPAGSLLWRLVNHLEEPAMPPKTGKLPETELTVLKKWIEGGLLENSGSKAAPSSKPKLDLAIKGGAFGKPEGPPPMPTGDMLLEPVVHAPRPGAVAAIAASPWAPLIAVAGQKQVLFYNSSSLQLEAVLPFPDGFPYVLRFSRSGQLLLAAGGVGGKAGKAVIYSVATGRKIAEVGDEFDAVTAVDISPDQTRVALGGPSKSVRIYSIATGELIHSIKKHTEWITSIAYAPDGVLLASADRNGGVHLWEAETGAAYSELRSSNPRHITALAWRPDANAVATAGEDGQIRLWEVENSSRLLNIAGHPEGVQAISFAEDGRIVSIGRDRVAKLWDSAGALQKTFEALPDVGLAVAISFDGTRAFGGDFSGQVFAWNTSDGKRAGLLDANPPPLAARIQSAAKRLDETRTAALAASVSLTNALKEASKLAGELENTKTRLVHAEALLKAADLASKGIAEPLLQSAAIRKAAKDQETSTGSNVLSETSQALTALESAAVRALSLSQTAFTNSRVQVGLAESRAQAANQALTAAREQSSSTSAALMAASKDLAKWKSAEFHLQVRAASEALAVKETLLAGAITQAEAAESRRKEAASLLESARKELQASPNLIESKEQSLKDAQGALAMTQSVIGMLKTQLADRMSEAGAKASQVTAASNSFAKAESLLKTLRSAAADSLAGSSNALQSAAKAEVAVVADPSMTSLQAALEKARASATNALISLEAANKAVQDVEALHAREKQQLAQAEAQSASAVQNVAAARDALSRQEAAVKTAETAVASATEAVQRSRQREKELVEGIPNLELKAATASKSAEAAKVDREKIEAETIPLRIRHEQLAAEHQKMKHAGL